VVLEARLLPGILEDLEALEALLRLGILEDPVGRLLLGLPEDLLHPELLEAPVDL